MSAAGTCWSATTRKRAPRCSRICALPVPHLSAREAFLYLLPFTTLYVSAWHLGSLLFDLINRAFPDPADSDYLRTRLWDSIRWSMASVIIAFPVFLYVARYLGLEVAPSPVGAAQPRKGRLRSRQHPRREPALRNPT